MGGNFNAVGNASISGEFNFLADPEAAYVVLNKTPSPIVLVPWEICGFDIKMPMVIYPYFITAFLRWGVCLEGNCQGGQQAEVCLPWVDCMGGECIVVGFSNRTASLIPSGPRDLFDMSI